MKTQRHLFAVKFCPIKGTFLFFVINDESPNIPLHLNDPLEAGAILRELQAIRTMELLVWRRVHLQAKTDQALKAKLGQFLSASNDLRDLNKQFYCIQQHWVPGSMFQEHKRFNKLCKQEINSTFEYHQDSDLSEFDIDSNLQPILSELNEPIKKEANLKRQKFTK